MMREVVIQTDVQAGQEVWNGFPGQYCTAPAQEGTYTLLELVDEDNTHAGWRWVREGGAL